MRKEHIKLDVNCQEVLSDKSSTGRERPWAEKKLANELLSCVYEYGEISLMKAARLQHCGKFLHFIIREDGSKRLEYMDSCKVRLCPLCAWRRSLKIGANVRKLLNSMDGKYAYIFLTLTVKNCEGDKLSETIDQMMEGWHKLTSKKAFKQAVKGWFRALEITHNIDRKSSAYDTFHPHFHVLLAVNKSYFTSKEYIIQAKWTELWKKAIRTNYTPVVDVRKVKGANGAAVAEVAKYTVKDKEYIIPEEWDLTVRTVQVLDAAMDGRRLIAFGGVMKEHHKKLNLDDEIDGNLINVDGTEKDDLSDREQRTVFAWLSGYSQYIRVR